MMTNQCQKTAYTLLLWCTRVAVSLKKVIFLQTHFFILTPEHWTNALNTRLFCLVRRNTKFCVWNAAASRATHSLILETVKATDLKDLSFGWSCLPVTFFKYDWLENKKQWWPRDGWELRYVSPFEVLPAVVMAGLRAQPLHVGLCVFASPSPAVLPAS